MEIELTKDSSKVLVLLYKEYLEKVKSGCSKSQSREFDGNKLNFITDMHPDDVYDCLTELKDKNLIKINVLDDVELTDIAIYEMENRIKKHFKNGLNCLTDLLSLIPNFF